MTNRGKVFLGVALFVALAMFVYLVVKQNWDALGGIGQMLEAIIVLVGLALIFGQLRQLRTEETHKKWDALQWSLDLYSQRDYERLSKTISDFIDDQNAPEVWDEIDSIDKPLTLLAAAMKSDYLDKDLYFLARASEIARLGSLPDSTGKDALLETNDLASGLIKDAIAWTEAHAPWKEATMSF